MAGCVAGLAAALAFGCGGGGDERVGADRAGPAYDDLTYSVEPSSLELGEASFEARGSVDDTLTCEGAHLSRRPRTRAGARATPERRYFTSFWTVEDCSVSNIELHVVKGTESADAELVPGPYPDGKPDVEYANGNQNFSGLSFLVSEEYDFFVERGEVDLTKATDEEVVARVKAVLEAVESEESPTPGVGIEGAFRIGRGPGDDG
jgi:hypothetical protein